MHFIKLANLGAALALAAGPAQAIISKFPASVDLTPCSSALDNYPVNSAPIPHVPKHRPFNSNHDTVPDMDSDTGALVEARSVTTITVFSPSCATSMSDLTKGSTSSTRQTPLSSSTLSSGWTHVSASVAIQSSGSASESVSISSSVTPNAPGTPTVSTVVPDMPAANATKVPPAKPTHHESSGAHDAAVTGIYSVIAVVMAGMLAFGLNV